MNERPSDIELINSASVVAAQGISPGAMLRDARFALDMSEDDVASHLRLPLHLIIDLENDDYRQMTSVTFVRGYLRSYARLVRISGDEVVKQFADLGFTEPEKQRASLAMAQQKKTVSHDNLMRYLTYLIVLVLGALVFMWWKNHNTANSADDVPAHMVTETSTIANPTSAPPVLQSGANAGDEDMLESSATSQAVQQGPSTPPPANVPAVAAPTNVSTLQSKEPASAQLPE